MAQTEVKILCLLLLLTVVNGYGTMVGRKTKINDVKTNNEVQELGKFSVEQYNNKSHQPGRFSINEGGGKGMDELVFSQVVEAQKQVVSGIKYFLKIEAKQNGVAKEFESVVVVKPWDQSKELLTFSPSAQ